MTVLQITLLIGLLGAFCMFLGDMILYYNKDDYISDGTVQPFVAIMKHESKVRLYIGGLFGPVSAFLYCVGFYHIVLFIDSRYALLGWVCFFVNCLAIIIGGTFHSHFTYLGLIGRREDKDSLEDIIKFLTVQRFLLLILLGIGLIALAVFIVFGLTALPRWAALLTPAVLFMFSSVMDKLPKGLHVIICGGWSNLVFVVYYISALILLH